MTTSTVTEDTPAHDEDELQPLAQDVAGGEDQAPRFGSHETWLATVLMISVLALLLAGFSLLRVGLRGETKLQTISAAVAAVAVVCCMAFAGFAAFRTRDEQ